MFKQLSVVFFLAFVVIDGQTCSPDETVKAVIELATEKDEVAYALRDKTNGIKVDENADFIGIPIKAFESIQKLVGEQSNDVDAFFKQNPFIFNVTVAGKDSVGVRGRDGINLKTIDGKQWIIGKPLAKSLCDGNAQ